MAEKIFTIKELENIPTLADLTAQTPLGEPEYVHLSQDCKDKQLIELKASRCDTVFLLRRKFKMVDKVPNMDCDLMQCNVIVPNPIDWRQKFHKFTEKLIMLDHNLSKDSAGDTTYRQSVNRRIRKEVFEGQTEEYIKETIAAMVEVNERAAEMKKNQEGGGDGKDLN